MNAAVLACTVVDVRLGGKVERCHNIPHHGSYSVAAHSWGVAMLLQALWPADFSRLALHALSHDVGEGWVGDVPSPTMRYAGCGAEVTAVEEHIVEKRLGLPVLSSLSGEDHAKLKACDHLEFYLWCRDQLNLGNQFALEPLGEIRRHWAERPLPERAQRLFERLEGDAALPRQRRVVMETCAELFGSSAPEECKF